MRSDRVEMESALDVSLFICGLQISRIASLLESTTVAAALLLVEWVEERCRQRELTDGFASSFLR